MGGRDGWGGKARETAVGAHDARTGVGRGVRADLEGGGVADDHAVLRELPVAQVLEQQLAQLARLLDAAQGDDAH